MRSGLPLLRVGVGEARETPDRHAERLAAWLAAESLGTVAVLAELVDRRGTNWTDHVEPAFLGAAARLECECVGRIRAETTGCDLPLPTFARRLFSY